MNESAGKREGGMGTSEKGRQRGGGRDLTTPNYIDWCLQGRGAQRARNLSSLFFLSGQDQKGHARPVSGQLLITEFIK